MYQIVKGYKQGRAVMFYDLRDTEGVVKEKVHKDDVVKLTEDGQVLNTKIQWWEGKPIVRMGDKNVPIIKITESGEVLGVAQPVVRNHQGSSVQHIERTEKTADISDKATVVGKLAKKRIKESIAYGGYDIKNKIEHQELRNSVQYSQFKTLEDLFRAMATDYNLKNTEEYLAQFAKKVNINKPVTSMNMSYILGIQNSINTYLMNMANKEINETFLKYNIM